MNESWTETAVSVAARAGCAPELVRQYAKEGLLPSRVLANGLRLFAPDAAEVVRGLKAQRLARRGRYPRGARVEAPA